MELFHVEPPQSDNVDAWLAWMDADKKAATVEKRSVTMGLEHGDIDNSWGHISLGFEGDFSDGTGELVAVVQANQESDMIAAARVLRKRGSHGSKRKSGAQRRKAKRKNYAR